MAGRRFEGSRTVRLGDVASDGLLRLDALARFLQDIAADDAAEVGLRAASWVVRRTVLELHGRPTFGERVQLTTFCGGLGSRWAERRTTVVGPGDVRVEASSLWVHLDEETGRPTALPAIFLEAYAEAAGGRVASSRLTLPAPPVGEHVRTSTWALRRTDFDVLGHVNNAAYLSAVEEELTAGVVAGTVELEYRTPIEPDAGAVELVHDPAAAMAWLRSAAGRVHAAARLTPP